jgi:type I restriction enzyme, S subunit
MIDDLKPYPEYKESGLPWLGKVPAHWSIVRNGNLFRQRNQTGFSELPILEVSLRTGVRVRDFATSNRKQVMSDFGKYKRAAAGDIAYNMMRMWQGAVGIAPVDGLVSPAYVVATPYVGVEARYFNELFRTAAYMAEVDNCSRGIVKDRNRLYWDQFKQLMSPCPPPDEQAAIVRFLGWAAGQVDRAILAKSRVIALLNEQKRGIIRRAVTMGLNRQVTLKETGIPWIGSVPQHWSVSRIKNEFQCLNTRRIPLNSAERGEMTARQYDYYGASGVIDKVDDFIFDEPLILIAEDGANLVLRNLPLAIIARGRYWVNNHAHILRPRRGNIEYLAHALEVINFQPWISGAAQPKLTQDRLLSISVAVAPREEQDAIVAHLAVATQPLTNSIEQLRQEVELLQEYRTRLVLELVTGQIDSRCATAQLIGVEPEEPGFANLLEDGTLQPDDEIAA